MGSKPCQPGCTCGRHHRRRKAPPKYEDTQCKAIEDGYRCNGTIVKREWELCNKHYRRQLTYGHYLGRSRRYRAGKPVHAKSTRCICMHMYGEHKDERCLRSGCVCKWFSTTNDIYMGTVLKQIRALGFVNYLNDHAACLKCGQNIFIGNWFDVRTIGQAKLHFHKDCPALHRSNTSVV